MKFRSALTRGVTYGSIFGGAMAVFPVVAALVAKAPIIEIVQAGALVVFVWGTLGFLAGFCSHHESTTDGAGNSVAVSNISLGKRLLYRFVAGLLLSYIAGAIVCGIGFVIFWIWHGDFTDSTPRNFTPQERDAFFIAFCGCVGAEAAAICGCWLGALLAPGGNRLGPVAKNALFSSVFGLLMGGWLSGLVGFSLIQFSFELGIGVIAAASTGAFTGIAAAVFLRLRQFR
jgi:hypothetical protein